MIVNCRPYLRPFEGYDKKYPSSTSFIEGHKLGFKEGLREGRKTAEKELDCLKHYTLPDGEQIDLTNSDVINFLVGEFSAGYKHALKDEDTIAENGHSERKRDAIDRRIRFMKE